jgi:toxin FitB
VSGFLIDTNVISEFVKSEPNPRVVHWFESADPDTLFARVLTLGEIRMAIENMPLSKRRAELEQWLEQGVPAWFQSNLLPVTEAIADRWALLTIQAKKRGAQVDTADGLIAATAVEHKLSIVTRNVKDFEELGIGIVNPWD